MTYQCIIVIILLEIHRYIDTVNYESLNSPIDPSQLETLKNSGPTMAMDNFRGILWFIPAKRNTIPLKNHIYHYNIHPYTYIIYHYTFTYHVAM